MQGILSSALKTGLENRIMVASTEFYSSFHTVRGRETKRKYALVLDNILVTSHSR